jgi:hypothetical protein
MIMKERFSLINRDPPIFEPRAKDDTPSRAEKGAVGDPNVQEPIEPAELAGSLEAHQEIGDQNFTPSQETVENASPDQLTE